MIPSLDALLHPHPPAALLRAIVAGERLHFRGGDASAFAALLPWSDFNGLITAEALFSSRVRAARRGRDLPLEMITVPGRDGRVLAPDALQALCAQGLSLVANGIDRHVPAIGTLATMLELALGMRIGVNCYASFNRDSAFRAHYDEHDILVLQLDGEKHWQSFGKPDAWPIHGRTFADPEIAGAPIWEAPLVPGDLLFLPRGEVHRATVAGDRSLHLTIRLLPPRGEAVLTWLAGQSSVLEVFRRDILSFDTPEALAAREAELRAGLHAMADGFDLGAFLRDRDREWQPVLPLNLGLSERLPSGAWVQPVPHVRDAAADGDAHEAALLDALFGRGAMLIGELADGMPGLSEDEVKAALARLARRSLVRIIEP